MANQTLTRKEEKEKKKKGRAAFAVWLKRLRAACKTLDKIDEWYELMQELTKLMQEYLPVIPADCYARIQAAMKPVDSTRKALKNSCRLLGQELEELLKCLKPARSFGKVLGGTAVGLVVTAALIVGAGTLYMELTSTEVVIFNDGCSTITLPGELPIPIPGVSLPDKPIAPGESQTVSLPRLTVNVDGTQPGKISVGMLGLSVSYNQGNDLTSLLLDGQELLGRQTTVSIGGRQQHELIARCR